MNKKYLTLAIVCVVFSNALAQEVFKYHKGSMYSVMLKHDNQEYCDEIVEVFCKIPVQDNFYDFNLSKRVFKAGVLEESDTTKADNQKQHIDKLLRANAIGRRLVAKWFNQDKNGTFNVNQILQKGYYNVNASDIQTALQSYKTQEGVIYDAGEELINNTYILVNDIQYGDKRRAKEKRMSGAVALSAIPFLGAVAMPVAGILTNDYSGFNVTVTSYLYKLDWTKEISEGFYGTYYTEIEDAAKKEAFKNQKSLFSVSYIGSQTVHSSNSNFKGVNNRETQIKLVCTLAIDNAIALLQKEHPEFRVRTPLLSSSPIKAHIGLREDVTENSLFEVLEVGETSDGRTTYKRVATIKPKKGKIWDNRYMAEFEEHKGGNLNSTEFEIVSGAISQTACLIREIDN
jgi:hypothetical protein